MKTVAVLVGSLRRDSINRKFAEGLAKLAADRLTFQFVEIGDLPLFNQDLLENMPAPVLRMKATVEAADAVLFVTPEHNRHFTPAIKNAIDWGSLPSGKSSWIDKPASLTGASASLIGTAAAQSTLRGLLSAVGLILMARPEVYFTYKADLFDETNAIVNADTKLLLNRWIDSFTTWIERTSK